MEINFLYLFLILIAILILFYLFNILRNLMILAISALIVLFIVERVFSLNLSIIHYLILLAFVFLIYALFEFLNLFVNVYEVIREMILIISSPIRRIYNILKRKNENKEYEKK